MYNINKNMPRARSNVPEKNSNVKKSNIYIYIFIFILFIAIIAWYYLSSSSCDNSKIETHKLYSKYPCKCNDSIKCADDFTCSNSNSYLRSKFGPDQCIKIDKCSSIETKSPNKLVTSSECLCSDFNKCKDSFTCSNSVSLPPNIGSNQCVKIQECSDSSKAYDDYLGIKEEYPCYCNNKNKCADGFKCINNKCTKNKKCSRLKSLQEDTNIFDCNCGDLNKCPDNYLCSNDQKNNELEKYKTWTTTNNNKQINCECSKDASGKCIIKKNNCGKCYDPFCFNCDCKCMYNSKKCPSFEEWRNDKSINKDLKIYSKYLGNKCFKNDKCNNPTLNPKIQKNISKTAEYYDCNCDNDCLGEYTCTNNINSYNSISPTETPIPVSKLVNFHDTGKFNRNRCTKDIKCDHNLTKIKKINNIPHEVYDCSCDINDCLGGFTCYNNQYCMKPVDCGKKGEVITDNSFEYYNCKCKKGVNECEPDYSCTNEIDELDGPYKDKCIKYDKCSTSDNKVSDDKTLETNSCFCNTSFNKCDPGYKCSNDNSFSPIISSTIGTNKCVKPLECISSQDEKYKCACNISEDVTCAPGYLCSNSKKLVSEHGSNLCVKETEKPTIKPSMQPTLSSDYEATSSPTINPLG